jgi:hypothetical protein
MTIIEAAREFLRLYQQTYMDTEVYPLRSHEFKVMKAAEEMEKALGVAPAEDFAEDDPEPEPYDFYEQQGLK